MGEESSERMKLDADIIIIQYTYIFMVIINYTINQSFAQARYHLITSSNNTTTTDSHQAIYPALAH